MSESGGEVFGYEEEPAGPSPEEVKEKAQELTDAVISTFSTPAGELTLEWLYKICGQARSSVVMGDSAMTHVNEGRRSVYLEILHHLAADDREIIRRAAQRATP